MLFLGLMDVQGELQVSKVKVIEQFRISKITDLIGQHSISQLTSKMFSIDGVKCEKALVSELFRNICESEEASDSKPLDKDKAELRKLIECFFA